MVVPIAPDRNICGDYRPSMKLIGGKFLQLWRKFGDGGGRMDLVIKPRNATSWVGNQLLFEIAEPDPADCFFLGLDHVPGLAAAGCFSEWIHFLTPRGLSNRDGGAVLLRAEYNVAPLNVKQRWERWCL